MRMRKLVEVGLSVVLFSAMLANQLLAADKKAAAEKGTFKQSVRPLLKKFCYNCHSGEDDESEAELSVGGSWTAQSVRKDRKRWERVLEALEQGKMPPKFVRQPSKQQREAAVAWLEATLHKSKAAPDPGRVTLRRLNRAEYANTVRDLIGVKFNADKDFPADDVGYGFDNIGDVLSLPPILMEKYMAAAEEIAAGAIVVDKVEASPSTRLGADKLKGGSRRGDRRVLSSKGTIRGEFDARADGEYLLRVEAYGDQAGDEAAKAELAIDGKKKKVFDVAATDSAPKIYEHREKLPKGKHRLGVSFINDYYNLLASDPKQRDRNLIVLSVEIVGPLVTGPEDYPPSHKQIIFVQPGKGISQKDAAAKILHRLATRAFRRPATSAEVDRLAALVEMARKEGESFEAGIRLALQAVLCSPHFLFMVPRDADGGKAARELDEYELAARMSYFLWSSMPDDELFEQAGRGTLRKNLKTQVLRMLEDNKSQALVDNFIGQWLQLRNLETSTPDRKMFGTFTDELRRDMAAETRLFVANVIGEDRPLLELIDADFTFVNQRLAGHYGIEGVKGGEFRRVSLKGTPRGGVLTQASVLTITSNPTRTSPVKRGKWIMENILGTPPPDPPADVPMLEEQAKLTGSLRERMEQHRKDPACAVCHKTMDPLGFAMENFDAVGRWRTRDGKFEIDASGVLPDGKKFNGPAELRRLLLDIGLEDFARCVAEKTLTYALGRGVERADKTYVDALAREFSEGQYKFSALVLAVVHSDPFQKRGPKQE